MSTTATSPRHLAALLVAHAQLVPSLTNPRKRFDKDRLEELALSMAPPVGILEPLVVRTLSAERAKGLSGPGAFYEIIAGERRWRAAAIAKLEEIPIVVREIADDQVIKLQLVENKNREDIHPLDEAEAMERLLKMNRLETPKTIAATIGMSERYVQNRLHYLRLVPEVKEAFRTEAISAGHVDLLMRLPADEQKRAFKDGCYEDLFDYDNETGKNTKLRELRSVRGLGEWIDGHVRLAVADAKAPEMELFPEVAEAIAASAVKDAPKLLELIASNWVDPKLKPAPLGTNSWTRVKKGETCDHQARGVIVVGRRRGEILTVCTGVGKCKTHWPHSVRDTSKPSAGGSKPSKAPKKSAADLKWEKRRAERLAREKQWREIKPRAEELVRERALRLKPGPDTYALLGTVLRLALPKKPTLAQLVSAAILDDNFYEVDDLEIYAPALGIDVKKLFAEAENKTRFSKMSDQEAGAAAVREQAKKPAKSPARQVLDATNKAEKKRAKKAKRKAGAKK